MKRLLDTNAVLYFLGGRLAEPLPEGEYFVSVITEMELLSYPLDQDAEGRIRSFLAESWNSMRRWPKTPLNFADNTI